MDWFWRRRLARIVAGWQPGLLLDLATGSGDVALTLRRYCPGTRLVGADFSLPMLREARRKGFDTVVAADGLALPFAPQTFDAVTIAFGLRNMASWPGALREMNRVLRPGGHVLILDFSMPGPPFRALYRPYLHRVLPKIAGALTGEKSAYEYLGASIEAFPAGAAMEALLEGAGFTQAHTRRCTGGIVSLYTACKPVEGVTSPAGQ